jgi:DNA-binding transcriptional LysR family regulator
MKIDHLREFIALSKQLSFRLTAKELHMTQPALSNHIHILEKEAGSCLVERQTNGGSRLTLAGQRFLEMAVQIVALHDQTLVSLKDLRREISGTVAVRTPRFEYSFPLLDYANEFSEQHPDIEIIMKPWEDVDGVDDVVSGAVDCAYVGFSFTEQAEFVQGVTTLLVSYTTAEVTLWLDRNHPLAQQETVTVSDLDNLTILVPSNHKNTSWKHCVNSIADEYGINIRVNEKYCDTLEDLALNKTHEDDIWLSDSSLHNFPPFKLRKDRIIKHLTPRLFAPICIACVDEPNNQALQLFIDYLYGRYHAAEEQHA